MSAWLERQWYRLTFWQLLLWPASLVFLVLAALRKLAYRTGVFKVWRAPVPVIVIGNITVGGTGKTPLVLWLARFLQVHGYHPGIVSRGYGSNLSVAREVESDGNADKFGDEPLLLARRSGCPVWVGRNRSCAARELLKAHSECDVLICDDGLQHYALARDVEIAVLGGKEALGNGQRLPAGPLRESLSRLQAVDAVVSTADTATENAFAMRLVGALFRNLHDKQKTAAAADFAGKSLHAVAGIGRPQRFFDMLNRLGLNAVRHPFPDHYPYCAADLEFESAQAVLMTEKDAMKCAAFAQPDWWYLEVDAQVSEGLGERILNILRS